MVAKSGKRKARRSPYKQIRDLSAPLGFPLQAWKLAVLAVRYHRGMLRRDGSELAAPLSANQKHVLRLIAAILHFARALAGKEDPGIRNLEISLSADVLVISAAGYHEESDLARKAAAARHPRPIL